MKKFVDFFQKPSVLYSIIVILLAAQCLSCVMLWALADNPQSADLPATQSASDNPPVIAPTLKPTAIPTVKPTATAEPPPTPVENYFAWNYIAEQEKGGIKVEIIRLVLAEKAAIRKELPSFVSFDEEPVIGMIALRITSSAVGEESIYPDQGAIIIGSEQIDLTSYMMFGTFGDDIGGEIYPGVVKVGGIWFGVKRTPLNQILSLTYTFSAFFGEDFTFTLDLSERRHDPVPDELK